MLRASFILVFLFISGVTSVLEGGEKYAFIVGIGGYDEKQLKSLGDYPRRDAVEFRNELIKSGFKPENIVLMVDDLLALPQANVVGRFLPEGAKIRSELQLLLAGLERDDALIIALAGHGVQFKGDDAPYFCPLDAKLDDKNTLISLLWLYKQLEYDPKTDVGCKPRQKLLLIDACRNDPASRLFRTANGPGLASVTLPQIAPLPEGVVALFSCAEGQQALQHDPLRHGVFFYHVLQGWQGAADGDKDRKVTLDELIAYTKSQTQLYARTKLAAAQTPRQRGFFDGIWELRTLSQPTEITNSLGTKLMLIPSGEFLMGSSDTDGDAYSDERPQHRVQISRSYYLGRYEVTQGEWKAVMGTEPWKGQEYVREGDDYPATYVSWEDALEYCRRLSSKPEEQALGRVYRLPTEAEWEYACRGGSVTRFHFGDDDGALGAYAWYTKNAWDVDERYAHRVGQKKPNGYGLYDMHGNVWEWCADWYEFGYYTSSPSVDPAGPTSGSLRVFRGGCWGGVAAVCRSAIRRRGDPTDRSNLYGFRLALSSVGVSVE